MLAGLTRYQEACRVALTRLRELDRCAAAIDLPTWRTATATHASIAELVADMRLLGLRPLVLGTVKRPCRTSWLRMPKVTARPDASVVGCVLNREKQRPARGAGPTPSSLLTALLTAARLHFSHTRRFILN